jgi:hypothetical protein
VAAVWDSWTTVGVWRIVAVLFGCLAGEGSRRGRAGNGGANRIRSGWSGSNRWSRIGADDASQ